MPEIPDYQSLMLPILAIAAQGETSTRTAMRQLAKTLDLPAAKHAAMLRDGRASRARARCFTVRLPSTAETRTEELVGSVRNQ
jgi:restriction endonuclease Mrr